MHQGRAVERRPGPELPDDPLVSCVCVSSADEGIFLYPREGATSRPSSWPGATVPRASTRLGGAVRQAARTPPAHRTCRTRLIRLERPAADGSVRVAPSAWLG